MIQTRDSDTPGILIEQKTLFSLYKNYRRNGSLNFVAIKRVAIN